MEIRKVQVTGGSSYIITLPKRWIDRWKIKKNDPVGLVVQSDETLLIRPKVTETVEERTRVLNLERKDANYLLRLLIAAYVNGYSNILVKRKEGITPDLREIIITFTETAIGPEIIEDDSTSVTIKDLINPTEMSPDKTVGRMYALVMGMHNDCIAALGKRERDLIQAVIKRDNEVDRLNWLVLRQCNMALKDSSFASKVFTSSDEIIYHFLISRIIERIGDHATRIAWNASNLFDDKVDQRKIEAIVSAYGLASRIFEKSIDSWFKKDAEMLNENIEQVSRLVSQCEAINKMPLRATSRQVQSISYISESIRRIGEYSRDILELVIDYLVGKEEFLGD